MDETGRDGEMGKDRLKHDQPLEPTKPTVFGGVGTHIVNVIHSVDWVITYHRHKSFHGVFPRFGEVGTQWAFLGIQLVASI